MSVATATDTVRRVLFGDSAGPKASTVEGLRSPLGESIVATVFDQVIISATHTNMRLELAELNRGDADADLGLIITPSNVAGIDPDYPEAWNVAMTLPTLLRILGQDNTPEGTPE